jgi:hypothetical protein
MDCVETEQRMTIHKLKMVQDDNVVLDDKLKMV